MGYDEPCPWDMAAIGLDEAVRCSPGCARAVLDDEGASGSGMATTGYPPRLGNSRDHSTKPASANAHVHSRGDRERTEPSVSPSARYLHCGTYSIVDWYLSNANLAYVKHGIINGCHYDGGGDGPIRISEFLQWTVPES